jgi:glyoxylase-like metal-dependent hydrolase (beta-lactamase superfamily II)
MIDALRTFEGGYCRQLLAMVDGRSWRMVRFPAVFFALRHRREGWVLVDTGYGARFLEATRPIPARFYRWATPTCEAGTVRDSLAAAGIGLHEIRHVIVTHFHGDHVGGLAEFEHATIHYHEGALRPLQALSAWRQVRSAFLPALVPRWLPIRGQVIEARRFATTPELPFPTVDLFGDGSITLLDLPGHAPGQLGVGFAAGRDRVLYAADAYWRRCQITDGVDPLRLAMAFQWDPSAYRRTVAALRTLYQRGEYRLFACHDDGVAASLAALPLA